MTIPLAPTDIEQERASLANLTSVLMYAQSAEVVTNALLAFPGITTEGLSLLFHLPTVRGLIRLNPRIGATPIEMEVYKLNVMRRAGYLTSAGRRLSYAWVRGPDEASAALRKELNYLTNHLRAEQVRGDAAGVVALQIRKHQRAAKKANAVWSGLLGWYTTLDERTSAECRRANGRNFDPNKIPPIGLPGAVHPNCRCKPGPPHDTDLRVERIRPDHVARWASVPVRVVV